MLATGIAVTLVAPKAANWVELIAANCAVVSKLTLAVVRPAKKVVGMVEIWAGVRAVMLAMGRRLLEEKSAEILTNFAVPF
jgi:hypothetical protein